MTNPIYQVASSVPLAAVMTEALVSMPSQDAKPGMPNQSQQITPEMRSVYTPGNAGMAIHVSTIMTGDPVVDSYQPRTELGRKLLSLRRAYVMAGGQLLDSDALDAEMRLRRGGVDV